MAISDKIKKFNVRWCMKWLFRLLSGIGISVVYYLFLSLFFDTPIEYEIKRSNIKLEEQYKVLNERFDSINNVLKNVVARDVNIHKILFESEPYSTTKDSIDKFEAYARMADMSNMELGDKLIERIGNMYQRVYNLNAQLASTEQYADKNRIELNSIPAIQPIENPDLTLLTTSFGNRIHPFYKTMKMHQGVDFSVPVGTAVFSTADGTIEQVSKGQNSGTSITIRHSDLYKTIYSNLESVLVTPRQKVKRGDIIAFSGNTGLSFAPHLHYEVRLRGKAVDPIDYFFLEVDANNVDKLHKIAAVGMQSFD